MMSWRGDGPVKAAGDRTALLDHYFEQPASSILAITTAIFVVTIIAIKIMVTDRIMVIKILILIMIMIT